MWKIGNVDIKNKVVLFLLLLLLSINNVYAINVDTTKKGKLNIKATYSEKVLSNAKINLYHVADMNENAEFTYTKDFEGNKEIKEYKPKNLVGLVSTKRPYIDGEWNELALSLDKHINEKKITPIITKTTDESGLTNIENLTSGLYLIKMDPITEENYQYQSSPSLISVPTYNEMTKEYIYDVQVMVKTESKFIGTTDNEEKPSVPSTDKDTTKAPNTYDNIMKYIILFTLSIIGIIVIVFYRSRKEEVQKWKKEY